MVLSLSNSLRLYKRDNCLFEIRLSSLIFSYNADNTPKTNDPIVLSLLMRNIVGTPVIKVNNEIVELVDGVYSIEPSIVSDLDSIVVEGSVDIYSDSKVISKVKDGESFTTIIDSSNGGVFRINNVSTDLSCKVYINTEEITDSLDEWRFKWIRTTNDSIADTVWNASEKAIGHKEVNITTSDCIGRTVFNCEVDLADL